MKLRDFQLAFRGALLTPPTTTQRPDRVRTITPMMQQWFSDFAGFCAFHHLALHCGLCRSDIENPKRAFLHWGECPGYKPALGDTGGSTLIKTPTGSLWIGAKPQRTELRAPQVEWLRQSSDVLPHFQLGLHCQSCQADVTGKNANADAVYSAACRCTEFIGPNREYREPAKVTVN